MNKEFDAMICPHAPSPFAGRLHKHGCEINPVGIDSFVHAQIRFHPVAVHISGIGFLGAEAAVNIDLLDARVPERLYGGPQSLPKQSAPRCESKARSYLLQGRLMIPWG